VEDFSYRLLGIRPMLASVHAQSSPARPCPYDDGRTVCAENWELRHLYVIEATPKPLRRGRDVTKRILYIDSEGWFITALILNVSNSRMILRRRAKRGQSSFSTLA